MSIFKPPSMPAMPAPPPPPPEPDLGKAAVLAEEAATQAGKRKKGAGATMVAGLAADKKPTTQKPTLLG